MQEIPALITDLTIILVVAALTTLLCKKINLPSVLGYILAGFLAGPVVQFLPTIEDLGSIEVWSDIGVIFLMFGLGLEFSVHKMAEVGVPGFLSAGVQAVGMGAVGVLVGLALGWGTMNSVFLGVMLAMSSTISKLGWGSGAAPKLISTIVVVGLVVVAGIFGYDLIMRCQQVITIVTGVITVGFFILGWGHIDFDAIGRIPSGGLPAMLGCCFFVMTGFGLGWVNIAADYSRYLPRKSSNSGIVFWTTFGASIANVLLIFYGLLLAGSNAKLAENVGNDPIGAMASILPIWYLIPYTIVAVLGLMSGSIMDNYSNGLALLSFGVKLPRTAAAGLTAALTVAGVVYVTFFSDTFIGPFQGFLTTLGVPMAVWAGMFVTDVIVRKKDYSTPDLYDPNGRYGKWNVKSFVILAVGTILGWGLVVNTAANWLTWQGYLLFLIGGKDGSWASANLGVIVALLVGLFGALAFQRGDIAKQEADLPASETADAIEAK